MAADRADEDNLKATSFGAGEWGDMPILLAVDYGILRIQHYKVKRVVAS